MSDLIAKHRRAMAIMVSERTIQFDELKKQTGLSADELRALMGEFPVNAQSRVVQIGRHICVVNGVGK